MPVRHLPTRRMLLVIDAGNGSEIWRREMERENINDDCRIYNLVVDDSNGDIYIGGKLKKSSNERVKIIDPKNPTNNPYNFVFDVPSGNLHLISKLNKDGAEQWSRTASGNNGYAGY